MSNNSRVCYECGSPDHFCNTCPKLNRVPGQVGNQLALEGSRNNRNNGNQVRGRAFNVNMNAMEAIQDPKVVTGTFSLNNHFVTILFDSGADFSFISTEFAPLLNVRPSIVNLGYVIEVADGKKLFSDYECEIRYHPGKANVVADALSRKERLKPRRVRALAMTIQIRMRERIQ
ncbi:reverse transcriptase domain-containing protein, partial [Tanacetum coccineum]